MKGIKFMIGLFIDSYNVLLGFGGVLNEKKS